MTQTEMVLAYLRQFGTITPYDAFQDLGCMRLSARVKDLRDAGHAVGTRMKTRKNRYGNPVTYAEYFLKEEPHE